MSYRVRYTTPSGATGYWEGTFATRNGATHSAQSQADITGYTFVVEELPDASTAAVPYTSTTERLVALMRERHAKGLAKYGTTVDRTDLTPEEWAQHAIEEMLDGAAYLMRLKDTMGQPSKRPEEVATPGSTAAHHVEILRTRVNELEAELANLKTSLATAPSVPVGASEAPGEGGDSDRRRLEALERWLRGENFRLVQLSLHGRLLATDGMYEKDVSEAPTLAALADKLMEKESKP